MNKICRLFNALLTVGDCKAWQRGAERPPYLSFSFRIVFQSKTHVAIFSPLTLNEESSVYGKRIIAGFAIPLLVF
jgi:hypothetical protein